MTVELIYEKVKEIKKIIVNVVQEVIEPASWNEIVASLDANTSGIYRILEDDLPVVRDLKAFLNMLTAIENMAIKMAPQRGLFGARLGNRITMMKPMIEDTYHFYKNYKIYRSTNSIITSYLSYLKDVSLTVVLPKLVTKMEELYRLCTEENFDKVSNFLIEQVIVLEQYQDNYVRRKQGKMIVEPVPKDEKGDDFVTMIVKKNDNYLRKIYKEKYDSHFCIDAKSDEKKTAVIEYYPEKKIDTDVIKNLKLLSNGIIAIKKVLDDHEAYQQSSIYNSVVYMSSFLLNLHKAYYYLSEFDYQAIIAEKSTPFTEEIKKQLGTLNEMLEKLVCIADQFELELHLKEGTLLGRIDLLIKQHNQIMNELRIPTDYLKQKHVYCRARLHSRQMLLSEIDTQIVKVSQFMAYRYHAVVSIPYVINHAMQEYITKYYDDICMDRGHLDKYQRYLTDAVYSNGARSFVWKQFEYVANYYGQTIHSELMSALHNRLMYLQKQRLFILNKNQQIDSSYQENPFDYVQAAEIEEVGQQAVIYQLLKNRVEELNAENEKLFANAVIKKDLKPAKEVKNEAGDKKESLLVDHVDKDRTKTRVFNKIQLKSKELHFFTSAVKAFEEKHIIPTPDMISKEIGLSPESVMLLHELNEVNKLPGKRLLLP